MWFRDIEFPASLMEAHRTGDLVIFVGAGASTDPPSGLPDFRSLAQRIAEESQAEVTDAELDRPDMLLGQLADDRGIDVRTRIAAHIGTDTSQPNRLHRAIASLSAARPPVRTVTTNFDRHLSSALTELGAEYHEYVAPALPMGDDFNGVVYLHGNLGEVSGIIAMDSDLGRAYLLDAWAARFLERMFSRYAVLFVGYSHNDVVMRYLGRALGRSSRNRFIMTHDPDARSWERFGITPIAYTVEAGSHEALVAGLEAWAERASMGLLQHRQRIADLVSAPPSGIPEDASYVEEVLQDSQRVRMFTEFARSKEWLEWTATQPEFRRLFDLSAPSTDCGQALAYWFAEHFIINEDLTGAALATLQTAGGRISPTLWSAIGHTLHRSDKPRPAFLGSWLMLLIRDDPGIRQDWLEYALVASVWPADRAIAIQLFDHLTEPTLHVGSSFGLADRPQVEIKLRGDRHWLRESWENIFRPNLGDAAVDVLVIVDSHPRRAHRILVSAGAANRSWDPISFTRSAIEPHGQDRIEEAVDVLIDAGRDTLELLLSAGDPAGTAYLGSWPASDVPVLRRLAVHGWIERTDVDQTQKLRWLGERGWLFDHQLRHEVFRLIQTSLSGADSQVVEELVSDAVAGPAGNEAGDRAYERFNALVWIDRHAPGLQTVRDTLAQIKAEHPRFQERPYPDLVSWMESGIVPDQPPMTTKDLHQLIASNPAQAIAELEVYRDRTSPFDGPTWDDALASLASTVKDNPEDGLVILDALPSHDTHLAGAVVRGWSEVEVDSALLERIVETLALRPLSLVARDLSRLLADGKRGEENASEWHRHPEARRLALRLWQELPPHEEADRDDDPLRRAINMPAGQIALFWLRAVQAEWRSAGEGWNGLPRDVREVLETILGGDDDHSGMAKVVFASQLHFFFAADEAWSKAHVLPLLDWEQPEIAHRCWSGFLFWGRWNDGLLALNLLERYIETSARAGEFPDEPRRQLASHLAGVALNSEHPALPWIRRFITSAPLRDRTEWARDVGWLLQRFPPEAVEHQWARWIREYWQGRLESIPTQLTSEESSAMASWVIELSSSIDEGVELALSHPAGLEEHGNLLHQLDNESVERAAAPLAKLLGHLLQGTQPPFWGGHYLSRLVPRLRAGADAQDVTRIVEEAVRLGEITAPTW